MAVKAIETVYAGHKFRSRLEARWAVFFNHLKVEWQYEPQGFIVGPSVKYLPDFYLPTENLWVEVKGKIDSNAMLKLAIYCIDPWVGSTLPDGDRLMIVGDIPPAVYNYKYLGKIIYGHELYQWSKGVLRDVCYFDTRLDSLVTGLDFKPEIFDGTCGVPTADRSSLGEVQAWRSFVPTPEGSLKVSSDPRVERAYEAARMARFEWGATPVG